MLKIFFISITSLLSLTKVYAIDCPEGKYSVSGHLRKAHYKSDGTYVSATTVSPHCRNYRNDGPLQEKFLTKMPKGWSHKKEKFKKCSKEKQKKISKILFSLPKILTSVGELKIYCATRSETPKNPATSAPDHKIITLYDSSFKMDTKRVIIHELAHLLWSRMSNKEKASYQESSHWSLIQGVYIYNRTSFSEPDGKTGPEEDFANNIEHYFSNSKKFKKDYSKIHKWIAGFIKENK